MLIRIHSGNSNNGKECLYAHACVFAIILNNKSNLRLYYELSRVYTGKQNILGNAYVELL